MMGAVADGTDSTSPPLAAAQALLRWWLLLLRELAHGPATLAQARTLLLGIGELPGQLERVVRSVEGTTAPLSGSLEDVASALTEIRDRLEHLDTVIWNLRDTVFAVVAAIPGGRRALERLPPPPPAPLAARPAGRAGEGPEKARGYDAPPCPDTRSTS